MSLDTNVRLTIAEAVELLMKEGLPFRFEAYDGSTAGTGTVDAIFETPQHSYTRALLDAVPRLDRERGTP